MSFPAIVFDVVVLRDVVSVLHNNCERTMRLFAEWKFGGKMKTALIRKIKGSLCCDICILCKNTHALCFLCAN